MAHHNNLRRGQLLQCHVCLSAGPFLSTRSREKRTLSVGIGTVGCTSIIFGLLDKIDNGKIFLGLSFTLRIIEACGNAGFLTGSFSMIAKEFPVNVATMFAILETFFGLGMIMGPTVGGALYEAGGFTLPFVTP